MNIKKNIAAKTLAYFLALLIMPAFLTLNSIDYALKVKIPHENPSPYGYTISLLMFLIPLTGLIWWFVRNQHIDIPKNSMLPTLILLIPSGILLDILFAETFFTFSNFGATLGINIPVVGGYVPIEELIFYIAGFSLVLLLYVWCDEYWLNAYNIPDYSSRCENIKKVVRFHPYSLVIGLILLLATVIYKKFLSGDPLGFPWYFTYLVVVAVVPSCGLYPSVKAFVNWRAFSLTCIIIVLISLLWEVTLALPYGWWGFKNQAMMGIYIKAWHGLPIEEIFVWLSVSYTTIIIFEAVKIWRATKLSFKAAILGKD